MDGTGKGNRRAGKGGEGMRGVNERKERGKERTRRGTVQLNHFTNRGDACKPESFAKLLIQKPNCKLLRKNSLFSVPFTVTTNVIYNSICDFLTGFL
jgi:hypothetical protein